MHARWSKENIKECRLRSFEKNVCNNDNNKDDVETVIIE
jgi:hypothetical protein